MKPGLAVQLTRDVGDIPRSTIGTVTGLGPEHALLRVLASGAGTERRDVIVPLAAVRPARWLRTTGR